MELIQKLAILADAAKYDASCASSGAARKDSLGGKGVGSTGGMGICHSYTPDGRCVSLLKLLMTNSCIYDCHYCINRRSSNWPGATRTASASTSSCPARKASQLSPRKKTSPAPRMRWLTSARRSTNASRERKILPFIIAADHTPTLLGLDSDSLRQRFMPTPKQLELDFDNPAPTQADTASVISGEI